MSSIRSILEKVSNYGYGECDSSYNGDRLSVDQAIKEVSELIDGAIPDKLDKVDFGQTWWNHAIAEYKRNLKELLK